MSKSTQKLDCWSGEIAAWLASGQTQRAWCLARGVNAHTFAYWRRRVNELAAPASDARDAMASQYASAIVPLRVSATGDEGIAGAVVHCASLQVTLPSMSTLALANLLRALA